MIALALLTTFALSEKIDDTPKETPVLPQFYRPATKGPSLSEITVHVPAKTGNVTIPAPSEFSGQLTVSLKVQCNPPAALKSWKLQKRPDGLNSVISAEVTANAILSYTALILCPGEAVYRTQVSDSKPWLVSSPLVQSGDQEIRSLSKSLKMGTKDDDGFVQNVVLWVGRNKTGQDTAVDALSALRTGGNSAGRANLCAAILRAAGIAARTVCYLPTWATDRIPTQSVVQYWTDEGNWETVDPTVGLLHPARNSIVVLSIATPADERRSPVVIDGPQQINLIKKFPHQFGGRLMTAGHRRAIKVLAAAEHGVSNTLDDNAVLQSLSKNPGNLAFLFDRN